MGRLRTFWKGLIAGGAAGAGVAALAAVNAAVARDAPEPETGAVGGEAGTYQWKHGQIFYRHAGREDAPAVLFVHGIGAGARAFMWRRNFLPLARDFRVYALDLLGFGYSDKPANAPYSAELYVELLSDFLRDVVGRYYAVSHLPGAQHAATAFLSGYLNTDVRAPFERLRQPVTLAWGKQDTTNPIEQAGQLLSLNHRARLEVFDRCRMMPQEEHAERFNALLRDAFRAWPLNPFLRIDVHRAGEQFDGVGDV